jgi:hypothetical protein
MTPATPSTRLTRAFAVYRRTADSRSAIVLVAANLIPLVGVLFFGWSLWTILAIYWAENGIVGLWNIPKILLAEGALLPGRVGAGDRPWAVQPVPGAGRVFMAGFFAVHYGLFWLVHGVFVLVLPSFLGIGGIHPLEPSGIPGFLGDPGSFANGLPDPTLGGTVDVVGDIGPFGLLDWSAVGAAALGLFVSHGVSFFVNYLWGGEYRTRTAAVQMFAPYGRLVVLHVTIIFGGFAVAFLGAPILLLVVLVALKTILDLRLHLREHDLPGAPSAALAGA